MVVLLVATMVCICGKDHFCYGLVIGYFMIVHPGHSELAV